MITRIKYDVVLRSGDHIFGTVKGNGKAALAAAHKVRHVISVCMIDQERSGQITLGGTYIAAQDIAKASIVVQKWTIFGWKEIG